MKNKIRGFLKLRKQSDTVKLICMLAFVEIFFLANTIYHARGRLPRSSTAATATPASR